MNPKLEENTNEIYICTTRKKKEGQKNIFFSLGTFGIEIIGEIIESPLFI